MIYNINNIHNWYDVKYEQKSDVTRCVAWTKLTTLNHDLKYDQNPYCYTLYNMNKIHTVIPYIAWTNSSKMLYDV